MKDKGLARDLWGFARDSVLEEEVRPRLRNWSQKRIMEHITRCREYRNTYKDKLLGNTNKQGRGTAGGAREATGRHQHQPGEVKLVVKNK